MNLSVRGSLFLALPIMSTSMVVHFRSAVSIRHLLEIYHWIVRVSGPYSVKFCRCELPCIAIAELRTTGKFSDMPLRTDEDEHSIEMHLPYVRKIFEGCVAQSFISRTAANESIQDGHRHSPNPGWRDQPCQGSCIRAAPSSIFDQGGHILCGVK